MYVCVYQICFRFDLICLRWDDRYQKEDLKKKPDWIIRTYFYCSKNTIGIGHKYHNLDRPFSLIKIKILIIKFSSKLQKKCISVKFKKFMVVLDNLYYNINSVYIEDVIREYWRKRAWGTRETWSIEKRVSEDRHFRLIATWQKVVIFGFEGEIRYRNTYWWQVGDFRIRWTYIGP